VDEPTADGNRWRARPVVAGALVAAVFAVPVVLSIGVAALLGHLWASASTPGGAALRWSAILGASTIVFFAAERVTRKAIPLTVLLKMGMVFPGRAPRRLSVARRSWTTRDLSRRIDEARDHGITDEPTAAAEQIVALAATLSAHDRKTRGHAERVRAFTDLIAEELRLPDDDRDRLRWSALLHDVGKLAVHSDILNKPGALSDDEWELMRQHPLEGAKLTAPLAVWLGPWAKTIAEHHERFDGRGYPYGLAGQDISMGGRIVAVADCYDTMTSLRSYKKPMSAETARAELAACAGAQFDPVMVRAFLAVSISRLHAVAPLTWIGSLPFGNIGPQLARMVAAGGRMAVTGAAATVGVVGLVAAHGAVASTNPARLSAAQHGAPDSSSGGTPAASTGGGGPGTGPGHVAGAAGNGGGGAAGAARHGGKGSSPGGPATSTTVSGGDPGDQASGTGGSGGGGSGGGQTVGGGTGGDAGPTTTVASGSAPPGTTTTIGGTAPPGTTTTTTTSTTSTTTTTVPPPLIAPSGVKATGTCSVLVVGPEVTLTWTASPTTRVTGYKILRGTTKTSVTTVVGTVSGRTTVAYIDTSVSGLGATYWYEVEAVAGASTATSTPAVSATTPTLCL
jgi:HD-GYP domain-containing protein (c-di-GMP phosphodiesterase class II)